MVGGGRIVRLPPLVPLPPGAITWIVPPAEPTGTVNVSLVFDATLNGTLTPPSLTCVAPRRFVPRHGDGRALRGVATG